ncbi:MAG: SDR family NAD(P)-dependent oxidoreductase, partial [Phycisphaerae bacterium]|nr:SDR family NAD(P)-dependent oxidoreductase [Phycisphaerae bacterium]
MMKLFGKAALVTGAARRLGRAIALALAEEGCDVAIAFRTSADEAQETARRIRGLGRRA